jgi:hypothetical protein
MEDEVIIIEVKPEMLDITNEPGKFSCKLNHLKKIYKVNQPITRRPEYLAIRDPNDCLIRLLFKIDQAKSKFEKGQIVPQGEPIKANIYLRVKDKRPNHTVWYTPKGVNEKGLVLRVIWYTSFKTMLTHNSTDDFIEEKSKPFTRVTATAVDNKILCNGSSCNHIAYCKFFNHSPSAIIKTEVQDRDLG